MERIGIVGLGYVGLSSAVTYAERMHVVGLDIDPAKVRALKEGATLIHEKGLRGLLRTGLRSGHLEFTTDYADLRGANFLFLAVGTPSLPSGRIDLGQVASAARALAPVIRRSDGYPVVVVKSTVVPGTTRSLVTRSLEELSGKKAGVDFGVCSNPEFLREGSAIRDTLHPERIVIGASERKSSSALKGFFRRFHGQNIPEVVLTDPDTAELVKYASNAFLATKVSFINLISRICENLSASDVDVVAHSMGLDPRIGGLFLEAGPGFGGSCFPKDLRALIEYSDELGVDASLLRAVDLINETQPDHLISFAETRLGSLKKKVVAVLGVSFKAGTDDLRESRAVKLVQSLDRIGARTRVYDSRALPGTRKLFGHKVVYCKSAIECIEGADLAVVMNAEREFKGLKPDDFLRLMRRPAVLDTRRLYDPLPFEGKVPIVYVGRG